MSCIRLVAIAKNEAFYLAEWIHHHFYFGFDEVSIILNECDDNSLELLQEIHKNNPRLNVRDGNALKEQCKINGSNFQIAAYAEELRLARQDKQITHVMCLDIDEFWIPKNLNENIHDFVDRYPKADSIAFSWYMEFPTDPLPFEATLQHTYSVQRDPHVKSIHRISDRLTYLDIHNAMHTDGVYVLANGNEFPEYEYNGSHRGGFPEDLFNSMTSIVDPAFVYHRIFRSQMEYVASLQRGRPGSNDAALKTNRWGYRAQDSSVPTILIEHPTEALRLLANDYDKFVSINSLCELIEISKSTVLQRFNQTVSLITESGKEVLKLGYLFKGVTLDGICTKIPPEFIFNVDSIVRSEGGVLIKGWAADRNTDRVVSVGVLCESVDLYSIARVDRPDVIRHFPGVDRSAGFSIEVKDRASSDLINLEFICDSHVVNHIVNLKGDL